MRIDLSNHLPYKLAVLSNSIKRTTSDRFVIDSSLSPRDWRVLVIIGNENSVTAADVVERTGMDKATVTRACQSLQSKNLIEKSSHPTDKRSQLLTLSQQGSVEFNRLAPKMISSDQEYRSALSRGENLLLMELIDKLQRHADQLLAQNPEKL